MPSPSLRPDPSVRRVCRTVRRGAAAGVAMVLAVTAAQASVMEIDAAGRVFRPAGAGAAVWSAAGAGGASPVAAGAAMTSAGAGGVDAGAGPDLPPAALTTIGPAPAPAAYRRALAQAAERAALSPDLLAALVWQESRWNSRARSRAGALGLGQLMPGTADMLGVNPHDPAQNLIGAATYLRQQLDRFDNNVELALAAYNAGPRRVARAGAVPAIAETRTYVATITRQLAGRVRGD